MEKTRGKVLSRVLSALLIVLALLTVCKIFFIDIYTVVGDSMSPTYENGQRVFARKVGGTGRFDAVIIRAENYRGGGVLPEDADRLFKRVVAVAGDIVWSENGVLCLEYDGETHILTGENYGGGDIEPMILPVERTVVPDGYVYVLGDNRNNSADSRIIGLVAVEDIEAVVL